MKKLLLLRHAKSSWKDSHLPDIKRPLNDRGRKAAVLMGRFIHEQRLKPDLVLCSPAERTRETATLVLESAGIKVEPRYDQRIYEADVSDLVKVIAQVEEKQKAVLLIGHNPGMEELLALLTGSSEHMPTASFACVVLNSENWKDIGARQGQLELFVKPKELARKPSD